MLPHDKAEKFGGWLRGWGLEPVLFGPLALIILFFTFLAQDPEALGAFFTAFVALSPLWLPVFLFRYGWILWMHNIRYQFWFSQDTVLLEIQLPPEVEKSPLAMEVVLTNMWNSGGEATFIARLWKGTYRPVWSFEIASNEGRVSFYVHMRRSMRNMFEARMYGQFPEAKIVEAEDYARQVNFNLEEYDLWGAEFDKGGAGALPIKTYYEYELDKDPDTPETTIDPLTHALEYFSSMGPGEYAWLQIIAKARKKDEWYGIYKKGDTFIDGGKAEMKKVIENAAKRVAGEDKEALKQAQTRGASILTQGERDKIEAIEKSMSKLVFECGIRGMYLAKRERFNGSNITGIALIFNPFRTVNLNQLNPARGMTVFDYPWQDVRNIRKNRVKNQLMFHYRNRAYFYVPYDQTPVFLNIEELASLWHFPGSSVQPPGLERVPSKRAEAPAGLPTLPS
jgi:hypothetical protein